jgi:hypothetical protein
MTEKIKPDIAEIDVGPDIFICLFFDHGDNLGFKNYRNQ